MAKRPLMKTPPAVKGKPPKAVRPLGPKAKMGPSKTGKMAF